MATPTTAAGPAAGPTKAVPAADLAPRVRSADPADFAPADARSEDWRFTPLDRLGGLLDDAPAGPGAQLVWDADLPDGVELRALDAAEAAARAVPPADRLSALAVAGSGGAVLVRVPDGVVPDAPVRLRLHGAVPGAVVRGHVLLEVGAGARAAVVLDHTGTGAYGQALSVRVGDGAALDLVSLQRWDADAVHAGHVGAHLGRDAALRSALVTLGGRTVRLMHTVDYAAPGGDAELLGVFFADAGQHLEHRLFVDHAVPHCRSDVVYKGALQGEGAHTVWVGDVLIRAAATGTQTYEINRNLVLSRGARADSVPNLEIETGDVVGAGHASATGRFDDEQLFYLRSRGIPEDEARRLVVHGFFADVLARVRVPGVAAEVLAAVDAELGAVR